MVVQVVLGLQRAWGGAEHLQNAMEILFQKLSPNTYFVQL